MNRKFMAAHFFFWTISASFSAYITAFALERGMGPGQAGVMVAFFLLASFTGQILWGYVCDRIRSDKRVFLFCGITVAVLYVMVYAVPDNVLFRILYVLTGLFFFPMGSILDSWLLKNTGFDKKLYGRAKAYDSISYALWMPVVGFLIREKGFVALPVCAVLMAGITLLIAAGIPDSRAARRTDGSTQDRPGGTADQMKYGQTRYRSEGTTDGRTEEQTGHRPERTTGDRTGAGVINIRMAVRALGDARLRILILVSFLLGLAFAPLNNQKILLIQRLGGTVSFQGIDAFVSCTVQFVCFMLVSRLGFIDVRRRLFFSAAVYFLSTSVFALAPHYIWIMAGSTLCSVAYTFLILATREYIEKLVDMSLQTTMNSLFDSVYRSFAGVVGLLYSGYVMERAGAELVTGLSGGYVILALGILAVCYGGMGISRT